MGLFPKLAGDGEGIDFECLPPNHFVASVVQLSMMPSAEGHREFIADFDAQRPRLCKAQMMGVAWVPPANETRLGCNKAEMRLIAATFGLGQGESTLVDFARRGVRYLRCNRGRRRLCRSALPKLLLRR